MLHRSLSLVVLPTGETDRAKWLDFPKAGTVLLIPIYIIYIYIYKTHQNAKIQGKKYTHTNKKHQQKTTSIEFTIVIKSVLVTNISCRFYDMIHD